MSRKRPGPAERRRADAKARELAGLQAAGFSGDGLPEAVQAAPGPLRDQLAKLVAMLIDSPSDQTGLMRALGNELGIEDLQIATAERLLLRFALLQRSETEVTADRNTLAVREVLRGRGQLSEDQEVAWPVRMAEMLGAAVVLAVWAAGARRVEETEKNKITSYIARPVTEEERQSILARDLALRERGVTVKQRRIEILVSEFNRGERTIKDVLPTTGVVGRPFKS